MAHHSKENGSDAPPESSSDPYHDAYFDTDTHQEPDTHDSLEGENIHKETQVVVLSDNDSIFLSNCN